MNVQVSRLVAAAFATERRKGTLFSLVLLVIAWLLAWTTFQSPVPTQEPLVRVSVALVLGYVLVERVFTKPTNVIANTLTCLIVASSLIGQPGYPWALWEVISALCAALLLAAIVGNLHLDMRTRISRGPIAAVSRFAYRLSTSLGSARILWPIAFIGALMPLALQGRQFPVFWYLVLLLATLWTPDVIASISRRVAAEDARPIGITVRARTPTQLDVMLSREEPVGVGDLLWASAQCHLCDSRHRVSYYAQILNVSIGDDEETEMHSGTVSILGAWHDDTACREWLSGPLGLLQVRHLTPAGLQLRRLPAPDGLPPAVLRFSSLMAQDELLGYVIEGSTISELRFQRLPERSLQRGDFVMIWTLPELLQTSEDPSATRVYYQVREVTTAADPESGPSFEMQWAACDQIGSLTEDFAFEVWESTPYVRTPVFRASAEVPEGQLNRLGLLPGTTIPALVDINALAVYHAAVLGTTGSGKTTLTRTMIGRLAANGIKVLVFDAYDDYRGPELGARVVELTYQEPNVIEALGSYLDSQGWRSIRLAQEESEVADSVGMIRAWLDAGEMSTRWHVEMRQSSLSANRKHDRVMKPILEEFLTNWYPQNHLVRRYDLSLDAEIDTDLDSVGVLTHWLSDEDDRLPGIFIVKLHRLGISEQQHLVALLARALFDFHRGLGQTRIAPRSGDPEARVGIVVEEAQIFVPQKGQFDPGEDEQVRKTCRSTLRELALGGRKYGVGLLLVSQRSAFVDKGVLSQCNTLVALRTVNENDKTVLLDFVDGRYLPMVTYLGNPPDKPEAILVGKASRSRIPLVFHYDLPPGFDGEAEDARSGDAAQGNLSGGSPEPREEAGPR